MNTTEKYVIIVFSFLIKANSLSLTGKKKIVEKVEENSIFFYNINHWRQ